MIETEEYYLSSDYKAFIILSTKVNKIMKFFKKKPAKK